MSYKQLLKSYIKICLKVNKPSFILNEFIDLQNNGQSTEEITKDQFAYIRVYDQAHKINKLLIICRSQDFQKYKTFYQQVTKRSIRNDLILNMLDDYYLDPDQIFYVFEMEQYNSTLDEIEKQYDQNKHLISKTKKQMTDYFNNSLHIFYQSKKQYVRFYICITLDNQLKIKFNLIDHNWIIRSEVNKKNISDQERSQIEKQSRQLGQLHTMEYEQELDGEKIYKMSDIPNMIAEFYESFNILIEKKDLLQRIQNNYSNVLNFHPLEIFKMIQSHPLYDQFQVSYSDEMEFELIVNKRGQTIILKGHQLSSLSKAEKLKDEYQFIILNKQLKNNSTILSADLLMTENHYYILIEKKNLDYIHRNTYSLANFNNLNLKSKNEILNVLSLLYFSQKILIEQNFQITKVNPQHLLFKDQNKINNLNSENLEQKYTQKKLNSFLQKGQYDGNQQYVQQKLQQLSIFDIQEFNKSYGAQKKLQSIMQTELENNNFSQKTSQKETDSLLIKYLKQNDISENQKEEVVKIYNWLILGFDIINSIQNNLYYYDNNDLSVSNNDFRKKIHNDIQISSIRIPILIIQEEIFYLEGFGPFFLIKQSEDMSIKDILKLELDTDTYFNIFGENYICMFQDDKLLDLQTNFLQNLKHLQKLTLYFENSQYIKFNLSGCKQIIQLNLEFFSQRQKILYDLTNILEQLDQTKINTIKILSASIDQYGYDDAYQPQLTKFYKLKRLVNIRIDVDYLDDNSSENEEYNSQDRFKIFKQKFQEFDRSF
ncbi:hypothetical protein ABPG74_002752 [Tetrahymena malaccensis]